MPPESFRAGIASVKWSETVLPSYAFLYLDRIFLE